ncbi:MAG: hypothetical protein JW737_05145 [Acidobacteria bacterium]|nr:hypothetical protein [Acidobacteriota bacterium]
MIEVTLEHTPIEFKDGKCIVTYKYRCPNCQKVFSPNQAILGDTNEEVSRFEDKFCACGAIFKREYHKVHNSFRMFEFARYTYFRPNVDIEGYAEWYQNWMDKRGGSIPFLSYGAPVAGGRWKFNSPEESERFLDDASKIEGWNRNFFSMYPLVDIH